MAQPSALLASLAQRIGDTDLAACSTDDLKALSAITVEGLSFLEGFLVQIATAARLHEDAGTGSPAVEVIRSGGALSKRRSEQMSRRAGVGVLLPKLGADLSQGISRPENADTVIRRSSHLSDVELRRLASQDAEVSERARALPPEVFQRYFTEVLRRVEDRRDEPSIAERQRAASSFTMGRRFDGMWWLKGQLDGERGAELQAVLRSKVSDLIGDDPASDNTTAEALHLLTTTTDPDDVGRARLPIGYIVDARTLAIGPHDGSVAQTWGGDDIDCSSAARLACNTDCYAVVVDECGQPGPVGRTRRVATRNSAYSSELSTMAALLTDRHSIAVRSIT